MVEGLSLLCLFVRRVIFWSLCRRVCCFERELSPVEIEREGLKETAFQLLLLLMAKRWMGSGLVGGSVEV